jgi:hypothetical protein
MKEEDNETEIMPIVRSERRSLITTPQKSDDTSENVSTKKIPQGLAKKMEQHQQLQQQRQLQPKSGSKSSQVNVSHGHRIPSKYAKHIENEVKKQTIKNVRNFSDLRKIKEMQNLDITMDPSKVSIQELRKLSLEKRKKDLLEQKKNSESNKKETAVQSILNNEKMSKFSKMVAIRNLSANSRRKINSSKQDVARLNEM